MKYFHEPLIYIFISMFVMACSSELPVQQMHEDTHNSKQNTVSVDDARDSMFDMVALVDGVKSRSSCRNVTSEYVINVCAPSRAYSDSRIFYVFNFENDGGFAIMTAGERPSTLIALSDSGNLVPGESIENPGLVAFLTNASITEDENSANQVYWETMRPRVN